MWSLKNNRLWYLLAPWLTALAVWGPYLVWNLAQGEPAWWRVPIITGAVYDSITYLQWVGQTINGLETGGHIRWFIWPLRAIAAIFPQAGVAEVWLISRWVCITLALWASAWAMERFSALDKASSRFMAMAFWVSFMLAIGQRPGVYSWYLPFGILCLIIPLLVIDALRDKRIFRAAAWTLVAVAASSVYSWFLVLTVLWLATIWSVWLIHTSRKSFFVALFIVVAAISISAPSLSDWIVSSNDARLIVDLQLKSGLGFTRLPQITNSFIAMLAWIVFILIVSKNALREDGSRIVTALWVWLAILLAWLITPFTGVYLHNDHFRTSVLIMSWISLALWWSILKGNGLVFSRRTLWAVGAVFLISSLFIFNIIRQPYAFNNDDLNVLHFSHWFALAMVCALALGRRKASVVRYWSTMVMLGAILIGGIGAASIYRREFAELPARMKSVPAIEWIKRNIPAEALVCSDPVQAEILGTFSGRRVFPAGTTLYFREDSLETLRHMQAYLSAYDAQKSGDMSYISYVNYMGRSMICRQFPYFNRLFKALGMSDAEFDELSGCPREFMRQVDLLTQEMVSQTKVDAPAFKEICPWVLISKDKAALWRLPGDYFELPINENMSAWKSRY